MERALTQEEIDAAFQKTAGSRASDKSRVAAYDFRHGDRIAKEQLRLIHIIFDNFAQSIGTSLSTYLRSYVVANVISIEQMPFYDFCRTALSDMHIASLSASPAEHAAILQVSPSISFVILDMLLGGQGTSSVPARALSEVEQTILEKTYMIIVNDLRTAWQPVAPVEFAFNGFVSDPSLLHTCSPNENIVVVSLDVRISSGSGMVNVVMHSSMLRPLRKVFQQKWKQSRAQATPEQRQTLAGHLMESQVTLEAQLPDSRILLEDLHRLTTGDVLALDIPETAPVDLLVNGLQKFRGQLLQHRGRQAVRVAGEAK